MRSAANTKQLPEPFEFFVDRSLGGHVVVEALRAGCPPGEAVHAHDEHFSQDATDVEWLAAVGERGWVVLTKDVRIRSNELERGALLDARVALFALGRGHATGPRMGEIFCSALILIRTVLRRYRLPIIAIVSLQGGISVRIAAGVELKKPKEYRRRQSGSAKG